MQKPFSWALNSKRYQRQAHRRRALEGEVHSNKNRMLSIILEERLLSPAPHICKIASIFFVKLIDLFTWPRSCLSMQFLASRIALTNNYIVCLLSFVTLCSYYGQVSSQVGDTSFDRTFIQYNNVFSLASFTFRLISADEILNFNFQYQWGLK